MKQEGASSEEEERVLKTNTATSGNFPRALPQVDLGTVMSLSHVQLFVTPRTVAHQGLLSMRFSRQQYWSGLPCPSPADLPNPGIEPRSPALQADSLPAELPGKPLALVEQPKLSHIPHRHRDSDRQLFFILSVYPQLWITKGCVHQALQGWTLSVPCTKTQLNSCGRVMDSFLIMTIPGERTWHT